MPGGLICLRKAALWRPSGGPGGPARRPWWPSGGPGGPGGLICLRKAALVALPGGPGGPLAALVALVA